MSSTHFIKCLQAKSRPGAMSAVPTSTVNRSYQNTLKMVLIHGFYFQLLEKARPENDTEE